MSISACSGSFAEKSLRIRICCAQYYYELLFKLTKIRSGRFGLNLMEVQQVIDIKDKLTRKLVSAL